MTDFRIVLNQNSVYTLVFRGAAPGVSNDRRSDYIAGVTRWIDTVNGKSYVCTDDTPGAASWREEATAGVTAATAAQAAAIAAAAADATTKANAAQVAAIAASVQKATGIATSIVIPVVGTITVVNGQITAFA